LIGLIGRKSEPGAPVSGSAFSDYFSPQGGFSAAVVEQLDRAKQSIRVQEYSFTSPPIAKAIVDAKRRGLDIEILLDKGQRTEKYSSADFVAHAGIPTFIDAVHAIAHNKVMVIDGEVVLTGSFNFTKAAEDRNAEDLLVIHDKSIAEKIPAELGASPQPFRAVRRALISLKLILSESKKWRRSGGAAFVPLPIRRATQLAYCWKTTTYKWSRQSGSNR
jgi:phosphatidylserine/phosphatidylglycerophosphate/cardiolipin synthase-like enzyme